MVFKVEGVMDLVKISTTLHEMAGQPSEVIPQHVLSPFGLQADAEFQPKGGKQNFPWGIIKNT